MTNPANLPSLDDIAEILYRAGWRSHADAQHDGLRAALPELREALASATQARKDGEA